MPPTYISGRQSSLSAINITLKSGGKLRVLSIMPKIPKISVGNEMERFVSIRSDYNILENLLMSSTLIGSTTSYLSILILTNRFVALLLFR